MQPSKEREASDGDPLDDLDDLLDGDIAEDGDVDRESDASAARGTSGSGSGGRIGVGGRWFSLTSFVVTLLVLGTGVFLGGMLPLVGGTIGHAVGVFLGAFLLGLVFSTGRYVETGIGGAGIGATSALLNVLGIGFLPIGLQYVQEWGLALLAVGGGIGLAVALLGHYFGRDLRDGLTSDVSA